MSRKVSYCAMMIALAMVFSYVEVLIPINFGIPGIKLGVANLVIVVGLYLLRPQEVVLISMIRILMVSYMFGTGMSLLYSLTGGILSFIGMVLVKKIKSCSILGVSMVGGILHNMGQLLIAAWVVQNLKIFYYFPVLLIAGSITGICIGILSGKILEVVKKEGGRMKESFPHP